MIINIFLHGLRDPLAREVSEFKGIEQFADEINTERIEKIVITDFAVVIKRPDGKAEDSSILINMSP